MNSSLAHASLLSIAGRRTVERCIRRDMRAFIDSGRAVSRIDSPGPSTLKSI